MIAILEITSKFHKYLQINVYIYTLFIFKFEKLKSCFSQNTNLY